MITHKLKITAPPDYSKKKKKRKMSGGKNMFDRYTKPKPYPSYKTSYRSADGRIVKLVRGRWIYI